MLTPKVTCCVIGTCHPAKNHSYDVDLPAERRTARPQRQKLQTRSTTASRGRR
jgi:hypothetical protein